MEPRVLDGIINRLLEVRGKPGKQVQLSESEIRQLCLVSKDIFLMQPVLLELEAPIKICGIFFYSVSFNLSLSLFSIVMVKFDSFEVGCYQFMSLNLESSCFGCALL